jgi:MFS family permease
MNPTAQIMLPLTADTAQPEKRAQALAITLSGLTLGVLVARVLSGTITNYSSWRNVYWMAVGLQAGESVAELSLFGVGFTTNTSLCFSHLGRNVFCVARFSAENSRHILLPNGEMGCNLVTTIQSANSQI